MIRETERDGGIGSHDGSLFVEVIKHTKGNTRSAFLEIMETAQRLERYGTNTV